LVQGNGFVSQITDDLDRFEGPNQVHATFEAGSVAGGVRGRVNIGGSGFTVLGGFSDGRQDYPDVIAGNEFNATIAMRYSPPGLGASRPFVEIGGLWGNSSDLTLTRTYGNGVGTAVGQGTTRYTSSAAWGRVGWIWNPTPASELGVYAEYGEAQQHIGAYLEPLSNLDPFEALVGQGTDRVDAGKLGARYTQSFANGWEASAGLTVAHAFSESQTLPVDVDGFGPVTASGVGKQTWVEYRARLGHSITAHSALSLFVAGVAGTSIVGDSVHVGADYRVVF
jgi:hypothetical protein